MSFKWTWNIVHKIYYKNYCLVSYILLQQVLLIAAILGDVEKARVALQKGANVNAQDVVNYKYQPIYFKLPLENYKIVFKL